MAPSSLMPSEVLSHLAPSRHQQWEGSLLSPASGGFGFQLCCVGSCSTARSASPAACQGAEEQDPLSLFAGHTAFGVAQDATGLLSCKFTL